MTATDAPLSTPLAELSGVGSPASRALAEQGLRTLGDLAGKDWTALAALHGVGPASGRRIQAALAAHGESLQNPPAPDTRRASVTAGNTGVGAKDIKTHATTVTPEEYLETVTGRRHEEGLVLLELFRAATGGAEAVMWGPSMIGFGEVHYRYASGREGDTFHLGFSPRSSDLSLYGLTGTPRAEELLARLGKHRLGKACLWVKKLEDVDQDVLREMVEHAWGTPPEAC